jgi:hypothetical protein
LLGKHSYVIKVQKPGNDATALGDWEGRKGMGLTVLKHFISKEGGKRERERERDLRQKWKHFDIHYILLKSVKS